MVVLNQLLSTNSEREDPEYALITCQWLMISSGTYFNKDVILSNYYDRILFVY